ncbi:PREDICTED: platelet binding protein GspB isoform X2 [Cyphomyrmex costatus]|uniref:platelet binding protein GspB isoform X2 n=1 Tax=Cyphomyrmex costatus TaxID=456900 RepID=UPI0008521E7A|nr:PREDICTED: platelet binding protein GspB isoform X2 [Cyphomyrmex costatus]
MEGDDGPSAIGNKPNIIKAQEEMGRLDVLVCGQCHSVFHFIEEFQEHRTKERACSKASHIRETNDNGQKAQVWAFLLWKDTQIQQDSSDKDTSSAWELYQKWCKMDTHVREAWVTAGKTIQTFTKISNAKMQDTPIQIQSNTNIEGAKPLIVRKVVRNGQPEETGEAKKDSAKLLETKTQKNESMEIEVDKKEKPRLKPSIKPKIKSGKAIAEEDTDLNNEEYIVDKILAKRFNPKKRCSEYLIKWEGYSHENNTWESAEAVATCKSLLDEFERNLAKQKELKAQQQANTKIVGRVSLQTQKSVMKAETSQPGPSTAVQAGRPMRSSKSKAMDQVKQWCGSMKDEENELLGKRRIDDSESDSEEGGSSAAKRTKGDTGSDDEWTGESEDERMVGRSDVIQRAFNRANAQSNGSNRTSVSSTDLATSLGLQSPEGAKSSQQPVLVASAKGVVKVDPKQMPNLASGLYVMSRKDGIIKLNSSPSGKLAVKGSPTTQSVVMVQNRDNTNVIKKQIISTSQSNSMTPVKVVSKMDGSQMVTQMKVVKSVTPKMGSVQKSEPVKIQPKPDPSQLQQIHVVTAVPTPITLQPRITTGIRSAPVTPQRTTDGRPLLPRPTLRPTAATSVLGTIRTPVRAPAPRIQAQATRPVLQKRTTTVVSTQQTVSPVVTMTGTVTQIRPKFTVLTTSPQSKQIIKTGTNSVQQSSSPRQSSSPPQIKQSLKTPVGKAQSLLSPQQKLLMVKRKAQEAAGIKPGGRGLLAGARAVAGRGRAKVGTSETPSPIGQTSSKPAKESKLAEGDGLHMEFHEVGSEESSSEDESDLPPAPEPDVVTAPEPDSPPRPFTLCPLTGRIIGPDGEPIEQQGPEPEPGEATANSTVTKTNTSETVTAGLATATTVAAATDASTTTVTTTTTTTASTNNATAELVLPSLDSLTESGGIMRVEMSPGGTTGTIVQDSETAQINLSNVTISAPDLPCLDDTASTTAVTTVSQSVSTVTSSTETVVSSSAETSITTVLSTVPTTSTVTMSVTTADVKTGEKVPEEKKMTDDASNLVTIAEHGVVYQVASQAEDGQTLLVTHGADGEQQCVYVTTEQQGDEGSVLTLDHAVAEAVAQLIPDQVNLTPQFYVKEDGTEPTENSMVMSIMDNTNASDVSGTQEDNDGHNDGQSVIAQVVQAEEPTPGGTRRVVLLLPDGNLMMTEVDEEQYAALELDK